MSRRLRVALDPGATKVGLAVLDYDTGELLWAGTISTRTPAKTVTAIIEKVKEFGEVVECVTEKMQKRPTQRTKHKSLDRVTATTDLLEKRSGWRVIRRLPLAWKRQVPKPICKMRLGVILSKEEWATIHGDGMDMYDAIGIGVVEAGRAHPGMVPKK